MAEPNEDVPYEVSDFATPEPEEEREPDEDKPYKGVLVQVQKYLKEAIVEHNSFDVLDLTEAAKMNPTQQIAVHKVIVKHLRAVKKQVDNKLKELV